MLTQQSRSKATSKGFTLIELMLATSLLMMVMFSGYYAYSLYSQKWQKRVQTFWKNTEQAIALDTLNKLTTSALPYIVNCKDDKACIYFKGDSNSVSFVTNAAIYSDGPALVQLTFTSADNDGNSQLIYREQSITNQLLLTLEQPIQWQHETELLTNLTDFTFSYYGWTSYELAAKQITSEELIVEDTRVWYQNHLANESRLLPERVGVAFSSKKGATNFQMALTPHSIYRLLTYTRVDV